MRVVVLAIAIVCMAFVAACGDDEGGGGGGGGGDTAEVTTLKVGVIPIADVAPLYLGVEQGFFEEENLKIEPQLAEGGAAIVPVGRVRRLPVRLLQRDVADHRRVEGPAGPDHRPGRARRHRRRRRVGRRASSPRAARSRRPRTSRAPRWRSTRSTTSGRSTMNNVDGEGGRRLHEDQVRRGAVPGHERGARGRARRRGLGGRAGLLGRQGRRRHGDHASATRRPRRTSPWRRTSPRKQYIAENGDVVDRFKRAIEKSLEYASSHPDEVRTVIGDVHGDPAGGARQDHAAACGRPTSTSRRSS